MLNSDLLLALVYSAVESNLISCLSQNLSSLCSNVSIDNAWTTLLGNLFYMLTIRAGNKYFLTL